MKIREVVGSVLAAGFAGLLMTPAGAIAAPFNQASINGTFVSTFEVDLNDQASFSAFKAPSAGLAPAIEALGKDIGTHGKCPNLALPSTVNSGEVSTVLKSLVFGPDSKMSGVAQITYDGAGSLIGEGVFNVYYDAPFTATKSIQVMNPTATGFTTRICGGPNAATEDARCKLECTETGAANVPYNCANQWSGTTSESTCTGVGAPYSCCTGRGTGYCLNPGGGGYTTSAEAVKTSTLPFANDSGSSAVIHFYISAFGICGSANSFAECCSDPTIDVISHVNFVNLPRTAGPGTVTESFGNFGDIWASGTMHSKIAD